MGKVLHVLIIEDVPPDAELVLRELKRGGFDVTAVRVDTLQSMEAELSNQSWDLIISDYSLPRFSALSALALMKEKKLDLPFIVVSGTIDEESAVEAIRAGAHDFMAKGKYARLVPAVERELREAAVRNERVKMREQLVISDRMASVGTLAAGVAHEINSPLAAIIANLDISLQSIRETVKNSKQGSLEPQQLLQSLEELLEPLTDARESGERVKVIVRDLKVFSRPTEDVATSVDVRKVLDSSLRIAFNEIRHCAQLIKSYSEVPTVHANEGHLGQVFLNLITNAIHAMPGGKADQNQLRIVTKQGTNQRVVVEICDTGVGIPDNIIPRIFDAFFTTKPIGVGTGLGLTICHRIVSSLGGEIQVESQVGKGTVFRIILPGEKSPTQTSPVAKPLAITRVKQAKVLLIDDEAFVCSAMKRLLSTEHTVTTTTSAKEALGWLSNGERFDVIICDLMMPEMTGMDFYEAVTQDYPEEVKKIVFMTGGAFTSQARLFLDHVNNQRIDKPFSPPELRVFVNKFVSEARSTTP